MVVRGLLQLWLPSDQVTSLFIQASQNKDRVMIIQKVQLSYFGFGHVLDFFMTCSGLQMQSQLESSNAADFIFIISSITQI